MNSPLSPLRKSDFRSRLVVVLTLLTAVIVGVIFALVQLYRPRPLDTTSVKVVMVYPSLAYFANPILGEGNQVEVLIPSGEDPHEHSPTPGKMETALHADIFVSLGSTESGLLSLERQFFSEDEGKPKIITVGDGISFLPSDGHGGIDIHFWLSPRKAAVLVENLQKQLSAYYPENSLFYRARAGEFLSRLQELDEAFRVLSDCRRDTVLVSHNAFSYLAEDYGFQVLSLYGTETEADLSPARMVEAMKKVRSLSIPYLFYTSEANLRVIRTIAAEMEVSPQPLYIFESDSFSGLAEISSATSEGYITAMRENLDLLSQALGCP